MCYNQGLMKAKVRDLSGAVMALRKSLELDKNNTNARNLLGLVYFEMGETVAALREWVVSKNLQEEDNIADEYIKMIQSNLTKLENTNQAIKKYNQALATAKQENCDLAIIQLKKVVSLNPKFIRAYQLLALLYIHTGEKDKAAKVLGKANAIDINNTTTLRYMEEVGVAHARPVREIREERKERHEIREVNNPDYNVFQGLHEFKEDKPSILPWLNLIVGVVLGIVACYVLIKPTLMNSKISELKEINNKYQAQVSSLESKVNTANSKKEELEKQIKELKGQKEDASNKQANAEQSSNLLLKAANALLQGQQTEAAENFASISEDTLTTKEQKRLYNTIKGSGFGNAARELYSRGYSEYERGKYETAIETLTKAASLKEDYEDANYIMGRCYMKLGQYDKAREIFQKLVDEHPTTRRGRDAKRQLPQLPEAGGEETSPTATPEANE